ncbi:2-Hydroxyacid oxidase 1-like [Uloborus diversus]|uniref:2-Hydroxyacid oxidase 1-like n=1 Tax=Uloborus diversus TaxID=327109 RepID=UPI0024099749|nr:2-Hydroxyacid oxidase 1-like [Uloborus diversus]
MRAGRNTLQKNNEKSFQRYGIKPKMLRDVSKVNLKSKVLDHDIPYPIGVSPVGIQSLVQKDAEILTARGCAAEECNFILSCASTCMLEDVAKTYNETPNIKSSLWFQIYIFKDRKITSTLLKRAENAGFSAIVLTVDSPTAGLWKRGLPEGFGSRIKNRLINLPNAVQDLLEDSLTFEDIRWLKQKTKLPIIVKGILSGDDANKAVEYGASAIFVSNHGERQIERVIPTIDCLEEIVDAVRGKEVDVYLDGGVRSGSDVFIALALGAKAVFIGRPVIWGLAVKGEEGVRNVLQIIKQEFISTMKLAGVSSVTDINRSFIKEFCR